LSPDSSPELSPSSSSTEPEANVENAAKDSAGNENGAIETALREILRELGLQKECVEEAINLFFESKPTEFESIMKKHFVLLLEIRDQKLKPADVEDRLIELKKEFGKLIRKHKFIPNTGQKPSALAKVIQVHHCITAYDKICFDFSSLTTSFVLGFTLSYSRRRRNPECI
jgi:hypothetical protein